MKKTLTAITLLAGAVSGFSQGQVIFADYSGGLQQQIFNVQTTAPAGATLTSVTYGGYTVSEYVGSTSTTGESPAGSAVFAAGTALSGSGFDAELLASATPNDTLSDLALVPLNTSSASAILHFNTSAALQGFIKGTSTVAIPGLATGATGTYAIAAWSTDGGLYTTLAAAQAADKATPNSAPWGISTLGAVTPANPAASIPADVTGFSLGVVPTPEPSTIALGVMGASALLFRRRK